VAGNSEYSEPASSLKIAISLTPLVFINDIGQRDAADWPEPAHGVADRQQGIGMDAERKAECGLRFFLELQIQRRQSRAQAPRDAFLGLRDRACRA